MRRPRFAPVPTIPDLQLTADRALSLHRPTRWQAQDQRCACRSLSLSPATLGTRLLSEVTSLDLHAAEIAADRAVHPSTGSGRALHRLAGSRPQLCVSPGALCLSLPGPALNLATTCPTAGASPAARRTQRGEAVRCIRGLGFARFTEQRKSGAIQYTYRVH